MVEIEIGSLGQALQETELCCHMEWLPNSWLSHAKATEIYPLKKMANDNHLFSFPCYNGIMLKQVHYNDFLKWATKINFSFFELCLHDEGPVRWQYRGFVPDGYCLYPAYQRAEVPKGCFL